MKTAAAGILVMVLEMSAGVLGVRDLQAQARANDASRPAFEVASIRPNRSGAPRRLQLQPGGRVAGTNVTVRVLIRNAYGLQNFQVAGGPDWIESDGFDIATASQGNPSPPEIFLMMRRLLAERFKLAVHTETRELPTYALVMARSDGRLGPQLRRSDFDCAAAFARGEISQGIPPAGTRPPCLMGILFGSIVGTALPISSLVGGLSPIVDRLVVDRTGLTGNFDLDLTWTPDQLPPPGIPQPPVPDGASIFTALQEQLGLKLEPQRSPVDVLVIDSVEQPTEN